MKKPRVAIFDFAGCEGCQLQIINLEEELLQLLEVVDVVEWREGISDRSPEFDIAIVEGAITRPQDVRRLEQIRARAKVLVALGACASHGGVNRLRQRLDLAAAKRIVYGTAAREEFLGSGPVQAIDEVVSVDARVEGCPIDRQELGNVLRTLVLGGEPKVPDYPVCVECKRAGNICRYERGEICLGPVTRGGCGARCPSYGMWCYGCRGSVDEPNIHAARAVMERYGRTVQEREERLALFGSR